MFSNDSIGDCKKSAPANLDVADHLTLEQELENGMVVNTQVFPGDGRYDILVAVSQQGIPNGRRTLSLGSIASPTSIGAVQRGVPKSMVADAFFGEPGSCRLAVHGADQGYVRDVAKRLHDLTVGLYRT